MRSFLSHNVIKFFGILAVFAVLSACRTEKPQPLPPLDQRLNADMVYPQDPNMIRTPKGRVATEKAWQHLGITPKDDVSKLF